MHRRMPPFYPQIWLKSFEWCRNCMDWGPGSLCWCRCIHWGAPQWCWRGGRRRKVAGRIWTWRLISSTPSWRNWLTSWIPSCLPPTLSTSMHTRWSGISSETLLLKVISFSVSLLAPPHDMVNDKDRPSRQTQLVMINLGFAGFMNARSPCCQVSSIAEGGNGVLCKRGGSACGNRSAHVFFDGLHPTEAANAVIARNAYASNRKTVVYPMNVEQLARI